MITEIRKTIFYGVIYRLTPKDGQDWWVKLQLIKPFDPIGSSSSNSPMNSDKNNKTTKINKKKSEGFPFQPLRLVYDPITTTSVATLLSLNQQ